MYLYISMCVCKRYHCVFTAQVRPDTKEGLTGLRPGARFEGEVRSCI